MAKRRLYNYTAGRRWHPSSVFHIEFQGIRFLAFRTILAFPIGHMSLMELGSSYRGPRRRRAAEAEPGGARSVDGYMKHFSQPPSYLALSRGSWTGMASSSEPWVGAACVSSGRGIYGDSGIISHVFQAGDRSC